MMTSSKKTDISHIIEAARGDTPAGFAYFYSLIHGMAPPRHAMAWIKEVYDARTKGKGIIIEAFRGSTKTTTMMTFVAYRIGLEPQKANLIIQVGDDIAHDNASFIADIIANNPMWPVFFEHIVPDKKLGWSTSGYEVMDSSMEYPEWRRKNSERKDPTLIGLGRTSRAIIGKHPNGCLIVDDIDDENTTSSDRERSKTQKILTGTIFPTMTPETWVVSIGTPWCENDSLAYFKSTGEFAACKTPVYTGEDPTWPEKFPHEEIDKLKNLSGEIEFARMFLLDLEAAKGVHLKREWLHEYPAEDIDPSWPVVIGVDYASTQDKLKDRHRDYFSIAVGRLIPGGGVVVVDGVREHVSQGEALERTRTWAAAFPTTQLIAVESIGKGEEFFNLLLRNSRLPIIPCHTGRKSKGARFEQQLAPLFQFSRAWITTNMTPFMKTFIDEWVAWPLAEHDDTIDAVYYMTLAATQIGNLAPPTEDYSFRKESHWAIPEPKVENPWKFK